MRSAMRKTVFAVALVALLPCCVGGTQERKVLLIGLDGVRVDILDQATTPNLDAMIAAGAFSDGTQTAMPTVSGPTWSSMLTGVWPEKHGVRSNNFQGNNYASPGWRGSIPTSRPSRWWTGLPWARRTREGP